jgi:NadR type nicotinamide-nucleotide adenylyltransferase
MIKIAVVGPESTGKSWMTEKLAGHYGTLFIPEYAREYCKDLNRQYTLEDEVNIFRGQVALEECLLKASSEDLIFSDTMILTVKIWCDHLFGHTPGEIIDEIRTRTYDLFLLMDIDLPWQDDQLRDFPHLRDHFMNIWHQELQSLSARYTVISGTGQERFLNAKKACDAFLQTVAV